MYEVEKNIPVPNSMYGSKYNFHKMEVGDSILIKGNPHNVRSAADNWGKRYGWEFKSRKTSGGVRLWRIS